MAQCELHGYYGTPFCSDCDENGGVNSAWRNDYRLFNEDHALGQNQYASRYINGSHGYPNLGERFRFKGDSSDYHFVYIHVDDYDAFRQKVLDHRNRQ